MDGIIEYLVKKERTAKDTITVFLIYIVAFVLAALSFMYLKSFGVIGAAAVIYGAYYLSSNYDVEFEYCILGKDIRIEKILSRKKRKPVAEIDYENILAITKISNEQALSAYQVQKTIMAAEKQNDKGNYVIITKTNDETSKIYIKPNDKMTERFETLMRNKLL